MRTKSSPSQFLLSYFESISEECTVGYKFVELQGITQPLPPILVQESRWKEKEWKELDV